jgi:transcriptional regulator with XRE-family HTH domain
MKRDRRSEIVEQRIRKSATYRKTFARTLHQIDLALLVREMREEAGLTQTELAKKAGTTQSVIARLEDAEYTGHSLATLERIALACGVALRLHAEKKPHFDREVVLVQRARYSGRQVERARGTSRALGRGPRSMLTL